MNLHELRWRLSRRHPPAEMCTAQLGDSTGLVLSTIHACRGWEANKVCLVFPNGPGPDIDRDEEARILFVAGTRAANELLLTEDFSQWMMNQVEGSGRCWRKLKGGGEDAVRVQFEVGLAGDVTAEGLAGTRFFKSSMEVLYGQKELFYRTGDDHYLQANSGELDDRYILSIAERDQVCLTVLSGYLTNDLTTIARTIRREVDSVGSPGSFRPLYWTGVRTLVLAPNDPVCEKLHEPFNESGILLAPVILGCPTVNFPTVRNSSSKHHASSGGKDPGRRPPTVEYVRRRVPKPSSRGTG